MAGTSHFPPPLVRVPTGIAGLDSILRGGLFQAGIYIVAGHPGAGKTTLANQACFHHVANGGRALYVTLLAETHGRMLSQLAPMSFFDPSPVGTSLRYINGFTAVESGGLDGLLQLLRNSIREQRADMLVLDGMVTASSLARSDVDYKRFINELQTWVGVVGCTVLFLTSAGAEVAVQPEHTMVDGIFELRSARFGLRTLRELTVTKFRGSAFTEGAHPYLITDDGVVVYPRLEGHLVPPEPRLARAEEVSSGVSGLDTMLGGGFREGSTTLLLGSSGSGKTILGLQFLAEGVRKGEPSLHFGFFEMPADVIDKADRLGLEFSKHQSGEFLNVLWQPPAERILDALAVDLLSMVKARGIKRLFIDGLVGFKESAMPERLSAFFSLLSRELGGLGVTTLITEETRELFVREIEVPTRGVSAIFHNILFLRQVEMAGELQRLISIMKTRDTAHDRRLHHFEISERGITIGAPFHEKGVLGGTADMPTDGGSAGGNGARGRP